ncbi:uncharacterized protein LOC107777892 isoform X2 [Nicotiana tabacum]|uniref:Uncharacterized protein LOC107777892 isoform X2 n=1 Tax=Nicotiana tabacum TaxID=4097 RepID=A0A1S3YNP0_TOBAC|nr:PREDICTED: uncharacterized protein LOC107777892 isoform X2 [Nicotiana tabacum]
MNSLLSKQHAYSKMEMEDPEEIQHRRAQFLIYKALQKADSAVSQRKQQPWLKVKVCKLKIKIGRRLKRFRKSILLTFSVARGGVYKQFMSQLKSWKRLLKGRDAMVKEKVKNNKGCGGLLSIPSSLIRGLGFRSLGMKLP